MAIYHVDDECVDKIFYEIEESLPILEKLQLTYSDCITSISHNISSLEYSSWEDDVQKKFKTRTDNLKKEIDDMGKSVGSEQMGLLISKLKDLRKEIQEMKKAYEKYLTYENACYYNDSHWEENDKITLYGVTMTKADAKEKYWEYDAKCENHIDQSNNLINEISSIEFGSPTKSVSNNVDVVSSASSSKPKTTKPTVTTDVITQYSDMGYNNSVTIKTTETSDKKETVITEKHMGDTSQIKIMRDKNEPRNLKIEAYGNTYEKRVNDKGQVVEVTQVKEKDGTTHEEEKVLSNKVWQVQVKNENTGDIETYEIYPDSSADRQLLSIICENAAINEGCKIEYAGEDTRYLVSGAGNSMTLVYHGSGSKGTTITINK